MPVRGARAPDRARLCQASRGPQWSATCLLTILALVAASPTSSATRRPAASPAPTAAGAFAAELPRRLRRDLGRRAGAGPRAAVADVPEQRHRRPAGVAACPTRLTDGADAAQISLYLSEIHNVAAGRIFAEPSPEVAAAAERLTRWTRIARLAMFVVARRRRCSSALFFARSRLAPRFRARNGVERVALGLHDLLLGRRDPDHARHRRLRSSSRPGPSSRWCRRTNSSSACAGSRRSPSAPTRSPAPAPSARSRSSSAPSSSPRSPCSSPCPIGLFTAIYLVEYASDRVRAVVKPLLEILAGVPTVVYGFFAVLTVAPAIRHAGGADRASPTSPNSALAAGARHGDHDHPVHLLALRRRASAPCRARCATARSRMGATRAETMTQGAAARGAARHHGRHPARASAAPSARR